MGNWDGKMTNAFGPDQHWGTFIKGVGDFVHVGATDNADGYDLSTSEASTVGAGLTGSRITSLWV